VASFEEKIEFLSHLLEQQGLQLPKSARIIRRRVNHLAPLSFAQERLWFLDQLEPGNPAYNISQIERLNGHLDVAALRNAITAIVNRHQILRTRFNSQDERPYQMVGEDTDGPSLHADSNVRAKDSSPLSLIDLSSCSEEAREAEAMKIAVREARGPFDLVHGPLFRANLVRLSQEDHLFILTAHQIVFDWQSHNLFSKELSQLYRANLTGNTSSLVDLPVQYGDFAAWQRDRLSGDIESQLAFWKRRLSGELPVLELPTDHPRPLVQNFLGSRQAVNFPRALTAAVKELSRQEGATLFMTLLATFQILLYRYTGQQDLIVGFPITNRIYHEIENLIGFFVNISVLRTNVSGNPTYRDLVERVRLEARDAFAHQTFPFERLVDELHLARELDRNPLFQIMFIFQGSSFSRFELPGVTSHPVEIDPGTSRFDVTLLLAERDESVGGFFEYNTDLFDRPTIERMAGHFQTLVEGIVTDPEQPISELPILTEAEKHQLLIEWNNTDAEYFKEKCIHELFEEQAHRTPDAIAITFAGRELTYRELNARSNQMANYLHGRGVGPGRLVGICLERSVEMVVGLLGILKAGGVYVPLDPSYPRERLMFMLEDAEISVLLTQERLIEDGKWQVRDDDPRSSILHSQMTMVCLDRDWHLVETQSRETSRRGLSSDDLAYVIYTSGSTGKPKGVQVSHRSVANCLWSIRHSIRFTEKEILLSVTTISFDIAALEIYLPLITGAKLVLVSREEATDGMELRRRLSEYSATAMQATPSTWRLLLDAGWEGSKEFKVLCGGEVLSQALTKQLLTRGTLWNLYGPTESTIWSTVHNVQSGNGVVPIGRPIANTQIYILDSLLQPVPVGVHGELYIGGDGLAQGYLNRPELTAEKFILSPFGDQPRARLYQTGDRARYRADGNIEFLGRVDNQIKIRGRRIELGEIETILNQHPAVKESVIVARERDSLGEKELVGYIVSSQDSAASLSELRGFLQDKLPDYMIPSFFVFVNALPLTPNGKIDRSNLPQLDDSRPALDQGFVGPRTEIEELVMQVWLKVLELDKIGVCDNFFELGGHSLLATRVIARLRNNFGIDLPLRRIFETPTVAGLARAVETALRAGQEIEITPILPVSREQPVLPSIAQVPVLSLDEWAPGMSVFNIPAAYRLKGTLDVVVLERSITCVVERHEALRTSFPTVNGQYLQFISPSVSSRLEVIDLRNLSDEDREDETRKLAREEAEQPFNLANGPLFRIRLLRLGDEDHLLLIMMHHIISDGWSMAVFFRDMAAFYEAFSNRRPPSLPELPIQYADFAHWQRQALRDKLMENQLVYWKKQLEGPLTQVEFPTSRTRVNELNFLTARKSVSITGDLFRTLKKVSEREESTLFITLLTSLKILLYCYTGEEDVRVGTLIANRNRRETENLIGHFANTLIIRTRLSGASSLREVARQVRDKVLDSYTHQDLPFESLVRELEDEINLNRASLCQVLFTYQTAVMHPVKLPALTVGFFDEAKNTAELNLTITTFDLILSLKERPEELVGFVLYKPDLFDDAAINRLLSQFHDILQYVSSEPDQLVSALCSLRNSQR